MKERSTVVTRKGQITIPAEFRRQLGIDQGDRIGVVMDGHQVKLVPRGSVVERTRGAMKSRKPALTARALRKAAEQAFADEASDRSGRR